MYHDTHHTTTQLLNMTKYTLKGQMNKQGWPHLRRSKEQIGEYMCDTQNKPD